MDDEKSSSFSKKRILKYVCVILLVLVVANIILAGCRANTQDNKALTETSNLKTFTNTPVMAQNKSDTPGFTRTPTPQNNFPDHLPVWGTYAPPSLDPITPIPPALSGLEIPDEVLVWVLLGVDNELPFTGRTNAIHVLLINPRLSKASLVSIPGNLYVYIPGYTMQRINIAYSVGGMALLRQTL
ncbi:MAG: LCP family protein, partial [Anaerolineaceae bacterium]|nr:LCP family protein [Anaerolineaceae bacterium]